MSVVQVRLPYQPRPWQAEVQGFNERFQVLALHRRSGKTELALRRLIKSSLTARVELPQFFYVAPFLKQGKSIAWTRTKQILAPLVPYGGVEIVEAELLVRFPANGATFRIYGADNPDAMRGVRLDGVVIDEVAQAKPEVWEDILQPALSDRKGWAQFIGTPKGINLFSELYFKAQTAPGWRAARYTVYDTNALDPEEVERLRRDMSESSFAREYLCDFNAAGDDQLISLADVEDAARREIAIGDVSYAPVILGVDPARFGNDRSVIFRRQGPLSFPPIVLNGVDNMALAATVAAQIEMHKPDAVFIDAGQGAGVIDRLRQLGHDVIEVNFGGRPIDAGYLNKRSEMWFLMQQWLHAGGAIPNNADLKQDLAAPIYWFDALNRKCLERKEDIKKRGLRSPDLADALALTFAQPVAKKAPHFGNVTTQGARRDYDPLSRM